MNKNTLQKSLSRQYICAVKKEFPIMRIQERQYLRQMKRTIDDYLQAVPMTSIDMLYDTFGTPEEISDDYFSSIEPEQLYSMIRFHRYAKAVLIGVSVLLIGIVILWSSRSYFQLDYAVDNEIVTKTYSITQEGDFLR